MAKKNKNKKLFLDKFSDTDVRTWKRLSDLAEEYHIKLFYHLEGQRQLEHQNLCKALENTKSLSVKDEFWWRIVDHKYSNEPLSAKGSVAAGGRFNIGDNLSNLGFKPFPALYLAQDSDTALNEKFGVPEVANGLSASELALRKETSFTAVRVQVKLDNVFDLTNASNLLNFTKIISGFKLTSELKKLAKTLDYGPPYLVQKPSHLKQQLLENGWRNYPIQHEIPANSQLFGRFLVEAGFEAVLFPSTKNKKKKNLAVFVENFETSDAVISLPDDTPESISFTAINSENWKEVF